MERWEIIERRALLIGGVALALFDAWLLLLGKGPERFAWFALLAPCTFWLFWQALFEDRLGTRHVVTRGERFMRMLWLTGRRVLLMSIAGLCLAGAWQLARVASSVRDFGGLAVLVFVAGVAAWVGVFGAGREKSMSDDRSVHRERGGRYK